MKSIGYAAIVAALMFVFAAIWFPGYRVQSAVTAVTLLLVGASILGSRADRQ